MFKSNEQGKCPKCNSMNLEYGVAENVDGMMIYYPYTCLDCQQQGEEWYDLTFSGHNAILEDGNKVEVEYYLKKEEE